MEWGWTEDHLFKDASKLILDTEKRVAQSNMNIEIRKQILDIYIDQ